MRGSGSGRAALALTGAYLCGGALNYLFQVHAAAVLDARSFGLLSAWLAQVTLVGTVSTVVQFLSLDFHVEERRWTRLLGVSGIASAVLAVGLVVFGRRLPPLWLGAGVVVGGVVLSAVVGQLQARLQLGVAAVALLVASAMRFAIPFASARDVRAPGFYVAQAASFFAGVVAAAALAALSSPAPTRRRAPGDDDELRLRRPILLAVAAVLFPLLDVLVISSTRDAATTGAFSRIGLASRVVFFAGAAALAVLLPHQLHAEKSGDAPPWFAQRLERWLMPLMLGGATLVAVVVDHGLLHPHGEERAWLYGTCLSTSLLVVILGEINRLAAKGRLGRAAACAAGVFATSVISGAISVAAARAPVTRYVVATAVGYVLVLVVTSVVRDPRAPAR